jgi:hypothetical protein
METEQQSPELNPIAIEIVARGLRGITPLIPPEFDGLQMSISDLVETLDYILPKFAARMSKHHGDALLREGAVWRPKLLALGDCDGLIELSSVP